MRKRSNTASCGDYPTSIQTKEEEADVVPVIGWLEVFATAEQQQY